MLKQSVMRDIDGPFFGASCVTTGAVIAIAVFPSLLGLPNTPMYFASTPNPRRSNSFLPLKSADDIFVGERGKGGRITAFRWQQEMHCTSYSGGSLATPNTERINQGELHPLSLPLL